MAASQTQSGEIHSHCKTCCKMHCTVPPALPESCPQIDCDLQCGFRFHSCKLSEHLTVCPEQRVPCINHGNGCPVVLPRQQLGEHLERCPASVVCCTMEWNRWPVSGTRRRVPLKMTSQLQQEGEQLDVALALRDQRMLVRAKQVPRTTRRALHNELTKHFPAVPINVRHIENLNPLKPTDVDNDEEHVCNKTSENEKEAGVNMNMNMNTEPQVLQLLNASKRASETLAAALSLVTENHPNNHDHPSNKPCASGSTICVDVGDEGAATSDTDAVSDCNCTEGNTSSNNASNTASLENNTSTQATSVVENEQNQPEDELNIGTAKPRDATKGSTTVRCALCPGGSGPAPDYSMLPKTGGLLVGTCKDPTLEHQASEKELTSYEFCRDDALDLDLNLEQITRYQAKPNSMYTFLCAQSFRRDEYCWHFLSVHSEIQGGLSGWLEHRCPLAVYGCTFSQRRLHPGLPGSKLVYSPLLESFGVQSAPHPCEQQRRADAADKPTQGEAACQFMDDSDFKTNCNADSQADHITKDGELGKEEDNDLQHSLLILPYEVLRHMVKYLDGYSLCNLSLTCSLLRDVCCSLLEERGIVIQEWEPVQKNGKKCWQITYKRWLFSTAFSPIRRWGFDNHEVHMSEHLKHCKYNCRPDPLPHPAPLPVRHEERMDPKISEVLGRMYPGVDISSLMEELAIDASSRKKVTESINFVPHEQQDETVYEGGLEKLVLPQADFNFWARGQNADKY